MLKNKKFIILIACVVFVAVFSTLYFGVTGAELQSPKAQTPIHEIEAPMSEEEAFFNN
jgi:hypothetical protein